MFHCDNLTFPLHLLRHDAAAIPPAVTACHRRSQPHVACCRNAILCLQQRFRMGILVLPWPDVHMQDVGVESPQNPTEASLFLFSCSIRISISVEHLFLILLTTAFFYSLTVQTLLKKRPILYLWKTDTFVKQHLIWLQKFCCCSCCCSAWI